MAYKIKIKEPKVFKKFASYEGISVEEAIDRTLAIIPLAVEERKKGNEVFIGLVDKEGKGVCRISDV